MKVYSEFSRISPSGEVVAVDRSDSDPREILSPAVPRNAFASYHVVATIPANKTYIMTVGQNPDAAVTITMYREIHDPNGIPHTLKSVPLPYEGKSGDEEQKVVFWLDLWVDRAAPVRRIKVEPQLYLDGVWNPYPMEVRVSQPVVPAFKSIVANLAPTGDRSDADAQGLIRTLLCGSDAPKEVPPGSSPAVRGFIFRNLQQDMALARERDPREAAFKTLLTAAKVKTAVEWCTAAKAGPTSGLSTEWFLKVRDFLYLAALD